MRIFIAHQGLGSHIPGGAFYRFGPMTGKRDLALLGTQDVRGERKKQMKISEWLDKKEAEDFDVSQIVLPDDLSYDEDPDEIIFFEEINPCGILCTGNHPFSTVERFGHWYYCKGQDKKAGIHSSGMQWRLFTKDKDLAVKTAKLHIE